MKHLWHLGGGEWVSHLFSALLISSRRCDWTVLACQLQMLYLWELLNWQFIVLLVDYILLFYCLFIFGKILGWESKDQNRCRILATLVLNWDAFGNWAPTVKKQLSNLDFLSYWKCCGVCGCVNLSYGIINGQLLIWTKWWNGNMLKLIRCNNCFL